MNTKTENPRFQLSCEIDLLSDDTRRGPGKIVGTLLTYGERHRNAAMEIAEGALSWAKEGIVLNRQHVRESPIMRFHPIVDGNKLRVEAELPDTQAGRDTAAEIRQGLFRGLSAEVLPLKETFFGGVRKILRGTLEAAAVVDRPAFPKSEDLVLNADEPVPPRQMQWY